LILLTTDAQVYANEAWLSELGKGWEVWVALVEEANPGDPDVQVVFEGGLKGDFTFVTITDGDPPLSAVLEGLSYQGVLHRGARVLFDRHGPAHPIYPRPVAQPSLPTEKEYEELISGFWLYALRVAKFTRRGDLWRAMLNLVVEVNLRLLTLMEWQGRARDADTWYDGRFIEEWADQQALEALQGIFPHYDAADLQRALSEAIELFHTLAKKTAGQLGYQYPANVDEHLSRMIKET
jgi:aminoglycoside 6-adenylyltransferase